MKLGAMAINAISVAAVAAALCLVAPPVGHTQLVTLEEMGPATQVQVRAETGGEVSVFAWSRQGEVDLAPVLGQVLHCRGRVESGEGGSKRIRCSNALWREGLTLKGAFNLAPVAQKLDGSTAIDLWLDFPRLGVSSTSMAMKDMGAGTRVRTTAHFEPGAVLPPIYFQFGYRSDQLPRIYLPLIVLALALTLVAVFMSRAGLAGLSRSAVLAGTILWMATAAQLEASAPLRILLFGSRFANLAAIIVELWPPLFCVAFGVAIGNWMRPGQWQSGKFGDVVGSLAFIPLVLTSVVGALPAMNQGDWGITAVWLVVAPLFLLLRRSWIRASARSRVRLLGEGEFKERVSALAVSAGCPQIKVYISFSNRSQVSAAFALPGKCIILTAALIRSLSKREVDAVAAHELSHYRHSNRGVWASLLLAMLLFETPAKELLQVWPAGIFVAALLPLTIYFVSLRGSRKREFAADASAAALTRDPRAMISSLARIARVNRSPLDMSVVAEWFSSHPSTWKRIRVLATAARLESGEVETLTGADDPGQPYEIPAAEGGGAIFTHAWQRANAGIYGWTVIFVSCGAGLLVAWLLAKFAGFGLVQLLAGIALGCILTKVIAATVMAANFARLRRKLEERFGLSGQLVGLAPDCVPRLYKGFRFPHAGLLRFERGWLCYQSERTSIALDPADVVEVGTVAASPSNWVRKQPMVRFRHGGSGEIRAFILHPVDWLPTQRRLLASIESWRATEKSQESTTISGFEPIEGQFFIKPTVVELIRGLLLIGGITFVAAILTRWILGAEWRYVWYALAVAACAHMFMFLPAMLYRPAGPETPPVDNRLSQSA